MARSSRQRRASARSPAPLRQGFVRRPGALRALRALALTAVGALLASCGGQRIEERVSIGIGDREFRVEVARTEEQQRQGLMFRRRLGAREGMLFVYTADQHLAFWMKNTPIPLTLLFLSRDGEIQQVEELKPGSLKAVSSQRAARYALELPRGSLDDLGAGPGDRVRLPEGFR
jgi:uncharacterized membrane protein (UPF0127 family)